MAKSSAARRSGTEKAKRNGPTAPPSRATRARASAASAVSGAPSDVGTVALEELHMASLSPDANASGSEIADATGAADSEGNAEPPSEARQVSPPSPLTEDAEEAVESTIEPEALGAGESDTNMGDIALVQTTAANATVVRAEAEDELPRSEPIGEMIKVAASVGVPTDVVGYITEEAFLKEAKKLCVAIGTADPGDNMPRSMLMPAPAVLPDGRLGWMDKKQESRLNGLVGGQQVDVDVEVRIVIRQPEVPLPTPAPSVQEATRPLGPEAALVAMDDESTEVADESTASEAPSATPSAEKGKKRASTGSSKKSGKRGKK